MFPQTLTPNDVFGTNTQAQNILRAVIAAKFPNIEAQDGITAQIIAKFYDYHFPYYMGEENANIRRWENAVNAWCFRNKKLEVVEAYYNANGTESDFKEVYTGEDVTTVEDLQTRKTTEKFNPINTPSSKISGVTESAGTGGTLTNKYKRGTTRTYSDGRKWGEVLEDVQKLTAPVYDFINGFGALLVSPYTPACDPWQYGTTAAAVANVETLPAGSPAKVTVTNKGTPLNALYSFSFELPQTPPIVPDFLNITTNVTPAKEEAGKLNLGQRTRPFKVVYATEYRWVLGDTAYKPIFFQSRGNYINYGHTKQTTGLRVFKEGDIEVGEGFGGGSDTTFLLTINKNSNLFGWSMYDNFNDLRRGAYFVATIQIESTTPLFKASLSFFIDPISKNSYNDIRTLISYFKERSESCPAINGKIFVDGQFYDVESIGRRTRIEGVTDPAPVGIRYLKTTADGGQIYNTLDISTCTLVSYEIKSIGAPQLYLER